MGLWEILGLVASGVVTTAGAVWALRDKLGDIEKALAVHVIEEASERKQLTARVVKLEGRRRR